MKAHRILVVDDDSSLRTAISRFLDRKGYQVITAASCSEALMVSKSERGLDVALIDLQLPDGDGLTLMAQIQNLYPNVQVMILTGFGTIQNAIESTKRGAFHFLTKPFNIEEICSLVEKAVEQKTLIQENKVLKSQLQTKYRFENIVGQSAEMTRVMELIERVADSDSTVLITGDSGTGKELVAQAIHHNSKRADKLMIPVNCGAIPSELLESELFGHIKGAFTGATQNRIGRFEMASGGTIFLDEIGEMSPTLQVKLLRVLQERCFEPVGSTKTVEVDVRVIAATNKDLEKAIEKGEFREDLYYRLNVIPIEIPALRQRQGDISVLLHHFMGQFNSSKGRNLAGFSPEAVELLNQYEWPGNVRELENLVERLAILKGSGVVHVSDLPEKYQRSRAAAAAALNNTLRIGANASEKGMDFNSLVDAFENNLILQALEKTGWNRNQAAQLLRLNRTTLVEKIKKKGLTPPNGTEMDSFPN
jgi:DNA-binding NtrC family response regulator